jgi:hypothetical protein
MPAAGRDHTGIGYAPRGQKTDPTEIAHAVFKKLRESGIDIAIQIRDHKKGRVNCYSHSEYTIAYDSSSEPRE